MQTLPNLNLINPPSLIPRPRKSELLIRDGLRMPGPAGQWNSFRVTLVDQPELSQERLVEQCKGGCRESFAALVALMKSGFLISYGSWLATPMTPRTSRRKRSSRFIKTFIALNLPTLS